MCVHAHARGRCCLCMYVCTSVLNFVSAHGGWRGRRLSSLSFFNFTDSCWSWNLQFSASPSGQQDSGLHLSQPSKPWVCKYVLHTQFFKAGAADLNTGLCAWETSPSLTEPSPFPFLGISIDSSSHPLCISNCVLKSDWLCIHSSACKCLHRWHLKPSRTLPSRRQTWDHLTQIWKKSPALQGSRNQHQKLVHFLFIPAPGYSPFKVLASVRQPFGSASYFV